MRELLKMLLTYVMILKFLRFLTVRRGAFDFYVQKGRKWKGRKRKNFKKYFKPRAVNTTCKVEIYKKICRKSRRASFCDRPARLNFAK